MKRGDVVAVAAAGGNSPDRRAAGEACFSDLCQMTSDLIDAPDFRITIDPDEQNGLRTRSQVMADKPVTIRRERVGKRIGILDAKDLNRLDVAIAFVMGLAD